MRPKFKSKLMQICLFFILVFVVFRRVTQEKDYEIFLPNQDAKLVWNYLADFSNIVKLNKKIVSWQLLGENVVPDENGGRIWSYKIISFEGMNGQTLFGLNENHGEITVEEVDSQGHYRIRESYKTFSFRKWLIINNWTKMDFKKVEIDGQPGTLFEENVKMDCPLIFAFICSYETDKNREEFFNNLRLSFS